MPTYALLVSAVPRRVTDVVLWRRLQHFLVEVGDVSTELRVVGQRRPRQRAIFFAHAKHAAERHHGVGNLPADLVDHDLVNLAELLAREVEYLGAFDLVGANKGGRFMRVLHGSLLPFLVATTSQQPSGS